MKARERHATPVLGALAFAVPVQAQTATIYGALSNFDVGNNTGQRYGAPTITDTGHSIIVGWASPFDPDTSSFTTRTVPHAAGTPFAGTCYQWYPSTYDNAGCEHFGVSLSCSASVAGTKTNFET